MKLNKSPLYEMIAQQTKDKIQELKEQGKTIREISRILDINENSCNYWYNSETRKDRIKKQVEYFRKLPQATKKRIYQSRNEYYKNYYRNRYKTDEVFRKKEIERVSKWMKKSLSSKS